MTALPAASDWRRALGLYLGWSALGHLAWEAAHMPLYTLAGEEPPGRVVAYGLHCTAGDVLIAMAAIVVAGDPDRADAGAAVAGRARPRLPRRPAAATRRRRHRYRVRDTA